MLDCFWPYYVKTSVFAPKKFKKTALSRMQIFMQFEHGNNLTDISKCICNFLKLQ